VPDAEQEQDNDQGERYAQKPEQDENHENLFSCELT
jgi:hypothetical protein